MKKKSALSLLVPVLIAVALLNLILFLTVPNGRTELKVFWLGWAFAFPVNLALAAGVFALMDKKQVEAFMRTAVQRVVIIASAVYLVFGIVLMYAPIYAITFPAVVEVMVTGGYLIALYFTFAPLTQIKDSQQEVKTKVVFIKLLQADLEACFPYVTDSSLLAALKKLSDKIRFSDPMSHPSLAGCESELSEAVAKIASKVKGGNVDDIADDIKLAESLIESRNSRCKILK